jgi:hypothetical protein
MNSHIIRLTYDNINNINISNLGYKSANNNKKQQQLLKIIQKQKQQIAYKKVMLLNNKIIEENTTKENDENYYDKFNEFKEIYHSIKNTNFSYRTNLKNEYKYFCFKYTKFIRNIILPPLYFDLSNEAVLIEFRCFPHLEFIIRNAIIKLGNTWSFTVVCGNINYELLQNIKKDISPNLKLIKLNIDNVDINQYSKLLTDIDLWNKFNGEKILIYQEDSIIFNKNIIQFLKYDYVGAPWPHGQNDNTKLVGNGGFSLRSKSVMIKVIKKISLTDTKYNSSTLNYMKKCNITVPPEDVYFSKNIIDFSLGNVADWDTATQFSTESIVNYDSFGGHNFWINDTKWKDRLYENNIIQFKPLYSKDNVFYQHRGGWKCVLDNLISDNFYNQESEYYFFDMIEQYFLFKTDYVCKNKWCGIIHCTPKTPRYLDVVNINNLFVNKNFIESLKHCFLIITLSEYITIFLQNKFNTLGLKIEVYTIKHPVVSENIPLFNFNMYEKNKHKYVIQIGQQLRQLTSIYLLNNSTHSRLWLTGDKNTDNSENKLNKECKFLHIDKKLLNNNVKMLYTKTFEEYDKLLSKNIVFIHLFDAAANNTVLECIIRNTPIIVNKIQGVVDYLGEDYPLYFNNLEEVDSILKNNDLLRRSHEYLMNMDKTHLTIQNFTSQLYTKIYSVLKLM